MLQAYSFKNEDGLLEIGLSLDIVYNQVVFEQEILFVRKSEDAFASEIGDSDLIVTSVVDHWMTLKFVFCPNAKAMNLSKSVSEVEQGLHAVVLHANKGTIILDFKIKFRI